MVTVLFAILIWAQLVEIQKEQQIWIVFFLLLSYALSFGYSPIKYTLTDDELIIHRPIYNVTVKKANIKSVELTQIGSAIRTFGSGGLFGYYGTFYNTKSGNMTWYLTHRENTVLVTTNSNKKIVLSPDEAASFVAAFQN